MKTLHILCFVLTLLLSWKGVDSLALDVTGMFTRCFQPGAQYTINSGGYIVFKDTDPGTNPDVFSLSGGGVQINQWGTYLVMAEAPFDGRAQMRFYLDDSPIVHSTVGQESAGVLTSFTTINTYRPGILRWKNPSGHSNHLSHPSNGSFPTCARLTLIQLRGGNYHHTNYLSVSRLSTSFGLGVNSLIWNSNNGHNLKISQDDPTVIELGSDSRVYFVAYQFVNLGPYHAPIKVNQVGHVLNAGHQGFGSQTVGMGLYRLDTNDPYFYFLLPSNEFVQTPHTGGGADVYNTLIIVDVTDLPSYGTLYSVTPPHGPYSHTAGDDIPLHGCYECKGLSLTDSKYWRYNHLGVYLTSFVFNSDGDTEAAIKEKNASQPEYAMRYIAPKGQMHSSQVTTHCTRDHVSISVGTEANIPDVSVAYPLPISVTVIQLS